MTQTSLDHRGLYGAAGQDAAQREAFTSGEIPVAVYGLGKMGLPLAAVYANVTGETTGVDIDPTVVDAVNAGDCPLTREPGLTELVADVVADGSLAATTDGHAAASAAAIHVVMVPTLLTDTRKPDLSMLDAAVETIGDGLDRGDLVLVESTVPPRTTTDRVKPMLVDASGLAPDTFGVAACPERTVSGQALADIRGTHPKVVGGVDAESTRAAALIYDIISSNEVLTTSDATTAEATKVFEGIYRDVNIAIANQLALFAEEMDIDVNGAIGVANTIPVCDIHDPGPGVGGHCIPVYPYFLSGQFEADASLLTTARERNDGMPAYTARLARAILEEHGIDQETADVLLFGMTYKANVAELRNAPSLPLATELSDSGTTVYGVDPLVEDWAELDGVQPVSRHACYDESVDLVILATYHDEFQDLEWGAFEAPVLDGRGWLDETTIDAPVYTIGGRWP